MQPKGVPETWPEHRVIANTWIIQKRLATGGFAGVYLAQHHLLATRQAVIKRLHEDLTIRPELVDAFTKEASTMDALRECPYVVQVWDIGKSDDNFLYIIMEYVAGGNLQKLMDASEGGALPVDVALMLAHHILTALDHAHRAHILHLDVKPQNILVHKGVTAKLADFGIAARIQETQQPRSTALRGLGSAGYSPIEQIDGTPRRQLDGRTDLYAFGMTLYRMLTGRHPFEFGNDENQWLVLIRGAIVPRPSQFRPELARWSGLDAFVLKLTARDRNDRFSSAADALAALAEIRLNSEKITTTPIVAKKFHGVPGPIIAMLAILFVVLILIGGLVILTAPAGP